MLAKVTTAVAVIAVVYAALCAVLFVFQRSLIYFPQPRHNTSAPTIALQAEGATVEVTFQQRAGAKAVLYFGGNAEDVSLSLPTLAGAFPGHALYLMHYRGYGGSSGAPTESALFADAALLFDQVVAQHPGITVVGRSLGSGVAVQLASVKPVQRLVLVTPYDSIQALAQRSFPFFPVRWLLRDKFESWRYAKAAKAPTLLVAAEHDEVIPATSTSALLSHFNQGVARLEVLRGVGHNTISDHAAYVPMLSGTTVSHPDARAGRPGPSAPHTQPPSAPER